MRKHRQLHGGASCRCCNWQPQQRLSPTVSINPRHVSKGAFRRSLLPPVKSPLADVFQRRPQILERRGAVCIYVYFKYVCFLKVLATFNIVLIVHSHIVTRIPYLLPCKLTDVSEQVSVMVFYLGSSIMVGFLPGRVYALFTSVTSESSTGSYTVFVA